MKSKLFLILFTAFTLTAAEAQSWSVLTSGTSLDLNDIFLRMTTTAGLPAKMALSAIP